MVVNTSRRSGSVSISSLIVWWILRDLSVWFQILVILGVPPLKRKTSYSRGVTDWGFGSVMILVCFVSLVENCQVDETHEVHLGRIRSLYSFSIVWFSFSVDVLTVVRWIGYVVCNVIYSLRKTLTLPSYFCLQTLTNRHMMGVYFNIS